MVLQQGETMRTSGVYGVFSLGRLQQWRRANPTLLSRSGKCRNYLKCHEPDVTEQLSHGFFFYFILVCIYLQKGHREQRRHVQIRLSLITSWIISTLQIFTHSHSSHCPDLMLFFWQASVDMYIALLAMYENNISLTLLTVYIVKTSKMSFLPKVWYINIV